MIARKTIQRVTSSRGVVAVSLSEGITNCGAGPALGPTANVNAPRTGWPSAEITRQKTRYQPDGRRRTGVVSSRGSLGELRGDPVATLSPAASVTDTIANLAAIGSSYVSEPLACDELSVRLATGAVRTR